MGLPMAARLVQTGFEVRGADLSADARAKLAALGGKPCAGLAEALSGPGDCAVVVAMLPSLTSSITDCHARA